MAKALNQAIEPITCGSGFIAERQMAVFASKLSDELSRRGISPRYRISPFRPASATATAANCGIFGWKPEEGATMLSVAAVGPAGEGTIELGKKCHGPASRSSSLPSKSQ